MTVLEELGPGAAASATGGELLALVSRARAFLRARGLGRGDRCALLAPNSIQWAAFHLALLAEGIVMIPLYPRQTPDELRGILVDCSPALVCCGDQDLRSRVCAAAVLLGEAFAGSAECLDSVPAGEGGDLVSIIYTSGTSGEPRGVMLTAANLDHMLTCTVTRLDALMGGRAEQERAFHYLPFCFAGSWILLLTCLARGARLSLCTDVDRLVGDLRAAAPHYVLNVPLVLDRLRLGVDKDISSRGGLGQLLYRNALEKGGAWLALAHATLFPALRRRLAGPKLIALISGSAPLDPNTQRYFGLLGMPVLQIYGLTETTAILTMDQPGKAEPGCAGAAIEGVEMRLADGGEILARGPNVFSGYWNKPDATASVLRDGWLHTGDRGESVPGGWRILGRVTDTIVLSSGHNVAPEPLELRLQRLIPGAQQVLLAGHGRPFLSAIITGATDPVRVDAAIAKLNEQLPHYERMRAWQSRAEPFSAEEGLLTANGKLKRQAIAERLRDEIEAMYAGAAA